MLTTRFTELVGCRVPIQQAGMGLLSGPELAAAVAEAGGLGMVSMLGRTPEGVAKLVDEMRERTSGVFGANVVVVLVDPKELRESVAAAAEKARVVEFFYSEPDRELVEIAHGRGALVSWQVGSREEAIAAEEAGCDLIVAQGMEAGGHVRGKIGLFPLLSEVLEVVKVPVLGAGGIGTGRSMAAALAAGAEGVRVGTRFVAAEEANAHPEYVRALVEARAGDTVYTGVFSVGWPDAPHRTLRSAVEAAQAFEGEIVGRRYVPRRDGWQEIRRFHAAVPTKETEGKEMGGSELYEGLKKAVGEIEEGGVTAYGLSSAYMYALGKVPMEAVGKEFRGEFAGIRAAHKGADPSNG
jgi:nitronate monooxygenase